MRSTMRTLALVGGGAMLLLLWPLGCGKPAEEVEAPQAEVKEAELPPVEAPGFDEALVTFLSGEVTVAASGGWEPLQIGDALHVEDTVRTGQDSFCELQFGDIGALRVESNTEVYLRSVQVAPDAGNVGAKLAVGTVLAKVNALSAGEKFSVQTQNAICGVRGTEFGVHVANDQTRLAVREGKVAVLPATVDVEQLKEQVAEEPQVLAAVERIERAAPVVGQDQEVTIGAGTLEQTAEAARTVQQSVERIVETRKAGGQVDASELQRLNAAADRAASSVSQSVAPPSAISQESVARLASIDKIRLVEIPVAPAAAATTQTAAPAARLERIAFQVTPADAEILLGGQEVGRGRYSGLYPPGEDLSVEVRREGFLPHSFSFTVAPGGGRLYEITLKKSPQAAAPPAAPGKEQPAAAQQERVSLKAEPADAQISLGGQVVGRGTYSEQHPLGSTLIFTVTREGYEPKTLEVQVAEGARLDFQVSLAQKMRELTVRATPADAEILLQGRVVGKGSYTGSFPETGEVALTVRRDGYVEQKITVPVASVQGPIEVALLSKEVPQREVTVRSQPADARILLEGRAVGTGSFTGSFPLDAVLQFRVTREGYAEGSLTVNVAEARNRPYLVRLEKLPPERRTVTIRTQPADARITVNGAPVGSGSYSGSYSVEESLTVQVSREGYQDQTLTIPVASAASSPYLVRLQPIPEETRTVTVRVTPPDAEIVLDGQVVGRGSFSRELPVSRTLSFTLRRAGYEEKELSVNVAEAKSSPYLVFLKGKPIVSRSAAAGAPVVKEVAADRSRVYLADRSGVLYGVRRGGEVLWSVATRNSPNENSGPVLVGSRVYFTGANELVIVEAATGKVVTRQDLARDTSHPFGRRVVPFGDSLLFPTNNAVRLMQPATAAVLSEIAVPEGSRMSPTAWGERVVIANQTGQLCILNPSSGTVEARIDTGAVQPIAMAAAIYRDRAYFAGRKGQVVCVDLPGRRKLWEATLASQSQGVFQDLQAGPEGVFVFSEETLYGFALYDGKQLFKPIESVSSPALYVEEDHQLYFGTLNKTLMVADAQGYIKKALSLEAAVTTRPLLSEGLLLVGTDTGEVIEINPRAIP